MIRSKNNSLNQKTQDQFDVFENLLTYPSSITILAEIMIRGQVSVKQLLQLEFIDLKKTIIYQRLADFENYQFIYTKKEQQIIQGKSGPRKATHKLYSLNNEIFEPMLVNLFKTRPRDAKLFGYYLQNAFIQREIRKLERMTNDEARDLFENKDFRFEAQKD
ncbi:MAG: hypothetical protein IH840_08505 [Candidatus Heimdallarchaeota archaeon]|nr:hypothetical protein [Candidatus Heimdallarchaeota archaeon]